MSIYAQIEEIKVKAAEAKAAFQAAFQAADNARIVAEDDLTKVKAVSVALAVITGSQNIQNSLAVDPALAAAFLTVSGALDISADVAAIEADLASAAH
jgi:hypothetical protein